MTAVQSTVDSETLPSGLVVHARAAWPATERDALPPIAGFIVSAFNPLVAEVAERCLRAHHRAPPADPARAATTGVVLASLRGDTATTAAVADALAAGRRVPPLLFFQSNPNAVVGHITARWGLAGPVVCVSPAGSALTGALAGGLAEAQLLLADGDATEVLVIAADIADPLATDDDSDRDAAVALLVGPRRPARPADRQP